MKSIVLVCPFSGKGEKLLFSRTVPKNQRASWESACVCGCSTFHTDLIYHILKDGVEFKDLGAEYYNQFNKERKINAYIRLGSHAAMTGQPALFLATRKVMFHSNIRKKQCIGGSSQT